MRDLSTSLTGSAEKGLGDRWMDGQTDATRVLLLCQVDTPVDNFGTVVGENPTPYGILALWAVNSLSIV